MVSPWECLSPAGFRAAEGTPQAGSSGGRFRKKDSEQWEGRTRRAAISQDLGPVGREMRQPCAGVWREPWEGSPHGGAGPATEAQGQAEPDSLGRLKPMWGHRGQRPPPLRVTGAVGGASEPEAGCPQGDGSSLGILREGTPRLSHRSTGYLCPCGDCIQKVTSSPVQAGGSMLVPLGIPGRAVDAAGPEPSQGEARGQHSSRPAPRRQAPQLLWSQK